jgi:hypothetical protein
MKALCYTVQVKHCRLAHGWREGTCILPPFAVTSIAVSFCRHTSPIAIYASHIPCPIPSFRLTVDMAYRVYLTDNNPLLMLCYFYPFPSKISINDFIFANAKCISLSLSTLLLVLPHINPTGLSGENVWPDIYSSAARAERVLCGDTSSFVMAAKQLTWLGQSMGGLSDCAGSGACFKPHQALLYYSFQCNNPPKETSPRCH